MAHYVDGFVVPVPRDKLDAYRKMAERAGRIWMEHGALQYWEGTADDVLQDAALYAYLPAKDVARARHFYEDKLGSSPGRKSRAASSTSSATNRRLRHAG
jgi:hypothetical protein